MFKYHYNIVYKKEKSLIFIRTLKVSMMIFFLITIQVEATEIRVEEIDEESYAIQVGAFKNLSNIDQVTKKLFEYETYLEPYKKLQRVHIVNIEAFALKETLTDIRKMYPKAFISKRPILNSTPIAHPRQKTFINHKVIAPSSKKIEMVVPYEQHLDSNTILKTRKSFL